MDPIGPQKDKFPNKRNQLNGKLGEFMTWESNAPKDLGGGFNKESGVRKFEEGRLEHLWMGKVHEDKGEYKSIKKKVAHTIPTVPHKGRTQT